MAKKNTTPDQIEIVNEEVGITVVMPRITGALYQAYHEVRKQYRETHGGYGDGEATRGDVAGELCAAALAVLKSATYTAEDGVRREFTHDGMDAPLGIVNYVGWTVCTLMEEALAIPKVSTGMSPDT